MRKLLDSLNLISNAVPLSQDAVRADKKLNALELVEQIQFAAASAAAALKHELHDQAPNGIDRVLLVEDDVTRRSEMANQLRADHFLVAEVSSGVEAIEYLYEMPQPDVIITDLVMADCDGWELFNVARTSRVGRGVLLVAVTEYAAGSRPLPDLDLLLEKQISVTQLGEAVRRLINQRSKNAAPGDAIEAVIKNRAS